MSTVSQSPRPRVQQIPIAKIKVPDVRISARYDDELAVNLSNSLSALGQIEPILVLKEGDQYILVDGLHRTFEAKERGDTTILAVVRDGDARQALLLNLATSHNKGKTHPGDTLVVIKALLEEGGMTSDEIASATGMSRDQVERFWKISEASPVLQHAIMEGTVTLGAAYQIARLPSPIQQEELVAQQVIYKRPIAEIKTLVAQTLDIMHNPSPEQPQAQVSSPSLPACGGCHQVVDRRHLVAVPLCPTCYGRVYRLAQAPVQDPPSSM